MKALSKILGSNSFVMLVVVIVAVVYLHGLYERRTLRLYINTKLAGR